MDFIKITNEEIKLFDILPLMNNPSCGAISIFIGTTRDNFNGKAVVSLEYEAYESMAMKEMNKICMEMKSKWPIKQVAIVHRIGKVLVTEASVIIVASAVHRNEAQESVMYGINAVKAHVPIWKKELYCDGSSSWKQNSECAWAKS